jgi:serine/threonine-protein kinase
VGRSPQDPQGVALFTRRADEIQSRRVGLICKDGVTYDPFFSPDGKWLGYTCLGIYKIPLSGGAPVLLTENPTPSKGATWSSRGIIYAPAAKSGLVMVREGGGPLQTLTVPDASKGEVSHRWPTALPDGRHVLFTIKKEGITSFDQGEIALLDIDSGTWKTIIQDGSFARYLPTGEIVFTRGDALLAVPFDLRRERVEGDPIPVVNGVLTHPGSGAAQYAVAQDSGTLVFVPGGAVAARNELGWIDRKGNITPVGAPLLPFDNPGLSPDGTRVAMTIFGATDVVGIYELARRSLARLPVRGNCSFVDWTPDGRQILLGSDAEGLGKQTLFLVAADGTGQPRPVPLDVAPVFAKRVVRLPDGLGLIHYSNRSPGISRLEGDPSFQPIGGELVREASLGTFAVSPDGRWLAYDSEESGRSEIYVTSFPIGGGNWQISHDGGVWPNWSPHGDEVAYYRGEDIVINRARGAGEFAYEERGAGGVVWYSSVHISVKDGQIAASAPTNLFKVPTGVLIRGFHPDGTRLLVVRSLPPQFKGDRLVAILNWADQVQARTRVH